MLKATKSLLERNGYVIAITFTIFLTISSLISLKGIGSGLSIKIIHFDKFIHFISYFLLTLCWFHATHKHLRTNKQKGILILLLIVYGIIIEVLQGGMTTDRTADFLDVLANSIGILLAATLFSRLNHWFNSI